jgi:secondary thiamine-phosphate synthase enzyme
MDSTELTIHTGRRRGLFDITAECRQFAVGAGAAAGPATDAGGDAGGDGLLNIFVPHATCGLVVMELGSGSEEDLLSVLERLLPRDDRYVHRHGAPGHGADHLIPAFFPPSITIPIMGRRLALGTWQSIALVDTNADNATRRVRLTVLRETDSPARDRRPPAAGSIPPPAEPRAGSLPRATHPRATARDRG